MLISYALTVLVVDSLFAAVFSSVSLSYNSFSLASTLAVSLVPIPLNLYMLVFAFFVSFAFYAILPSSVSFRPNLLSSAPYCISEFAAILPLALTRYASFSVGALTRYASPILFSNPLRFPSILPHYRTLYSLRASASFSGPNRSLRFIPHGPHSISPIQHSHLNIPAQFLCQTPHSISPTRYALGCLFSYLRELLFIPHSAQHLILFWETLMQPAPISLALLLFCITQYFTHFAPIFLALLLLSVLAFASFHSAPISPLRSLFSVLYLLSLTYSSYLIFLLEFISFFFAPAYSTRFAFLYAFIPLAIVCLVLV